MSEPGENMFCSIVRRQMAEKDISLRELCRQSMVDPSFISKVLSGKRNPPYDDAVLSALASTLGVAESMMFLSVGKLPPGWRKVAEDSALFEKVDRILDGRGSAGAVQIRKSDSFSQQHDGEMPSELL